MTPKEKAEQLIESFKPYMYCYMGSGMLSDCYDEKIVLYNAIKSSLITVDEIINSSPSLPILSESGSLYNDIEESKSFWQQVKKEILKKQNNV